MPMSPTRENDALNLDLVKDKDKPDKFMFEFSRESFKKAGADISSVPDDKFPADLKIFYSGKKSADGKSITIDEMIVPNGRATLATPVNIDIQNDQVLLEKSDADNLLSSDLKIRRSDVTGAAAGAGGDTTRGDTDPARGGTDAGREKPKGIMESAGEFANDNKMALGGGLMVGLLAAAMGSGGIMGLILGLLAAILIGGMLGMGKGGSEKTGGPEKNEPEKGKGKALKIDGAPGPENAIDVKEGEKVQLVKMDGTKKTYLSGQDREGNLQYSDTPTEITLRTQDEKGNFKSLIKGKVTNEGKEFFVESAASTIPGGNGRMGDMTDSKRLIQLDDNGNMGLNSPAMTDARKPAAEAAAAFAKTQEIELKRDGTRVTADYGTVEIEGKKYTTVASGTMGAEGKKATFDKAMLKDGDQFVKGADGKPIELTLPNIALNVENNKISPMTGDVKAGSTAIADAVLKEQKSQFGAKEAADSKRADNTLAAVTKAETNDSQKATLREVFSARLEELGITDTNQRAVMSSNIADKYMDANFRAVKPEEAGKTIADMVGSEGRIQAEMGDFAARIQEGVAKAMNARMPKAPTATAPVADTAAVADAARGATEAGTSAPQEASATGPDGRAAMTGTTGPALTGVTRK